MTLLDDAIQDDVAWGAMVSGGPGTVDPRGWWLSPGCADVDLTAAGFRVPLDATWIGRAAGRGAVADASGWEVVGLSDVFGADPWPGLLPAVASSDVVGYEHGDDLTAAVRAGMTPLGPLRVWVR